MTKNRKKSFSELQAEAARAQQDAARVKAQAERLKAQQDAGTGSADASDKPKPGKSAKG
jgi:hypothetical protein